MKRITFKVSDKNEKIINNLAKLNNKSKSEIINEMISEYNLLNLKLDLILENQEEMKRSINETDKV